MDRLQEMASFVAVVEAGSFVRAAEGLGLSKAAVSRHVADLEQRLGTRLLHRTTRRLSLTDEGHRFHARAREVLAALDEAEAEAMARSSEATGTLRINAPLSFGVLHLAPLWGAFLGSNPQVALEVTLSDRTVDLVEEGFDLAVRIARQPAPQLVARRLATTRVVLCAAPDYLQRRGTPRQPAELADHDVVGYSYWSGGDEWSFHGPGGEATVRTRPRLSSNNGDTCRQLALQGQGIVLQPDFIVGDDLAAGRLVELMPGYRAAEFGIWAVYASRKHLPAKVRRMVDFLVEAFAQPRWTRCPD